MIRQQAGLSVASVLLGMLAVSSCGGGNIAPVPPAAPASGGISSANASQPSTAQAAGSAAAPAPAPVVNNSSGSGGAGATSYACVSQTSCPPADLDYIGPFSATGQLTGTVGTAVVWQFRGVDHNTFNASTNLSTRNVMVLFANLPTGAAVSPDPSNGTLANLAILSLPAPTAAASGTLSVIVRDYDRCVINQSTAACNQITLNSTYDKQFASVPFQIVTAAATGSSATETAPTTGTTATSNSTGTTKTNSNNSGCPTDGDFFGSLIDSLLCF